MIQVRNNKTGKLEQIDDGGLPELLNSNEYSLLKNQELEFEDTEGQRRIVPSDQVFDAIDAGFKHVPQKQIQKEEMLDVAADEPFKAAGAGLLRGLSLGLSDQILTATGITSPDKLKALEEANPIISTASEITGEIAPIVVSGGTSIGAKVLSKTPSALADVLATEAAKKALPLSGKILSKTASNLTKSVVDNAVKYGTGSAVEGALFGLGNLISEEALGDAEFNAETALASMGSGALLGGTFGLFAGSAAGMVGEGAKAIKNQYNKLQKSLIESIEDPNIKKDILTKLSNEETADELLKKIGATADEVADKFELEQAAKRIGVPLTPGMKETEKTFAGLEASLLKEPSIGGILTRKEVQKTYDALDNIQNLINKDAADVDKVTIGESVRSGVKAKISEELEPASLLYQEIEPRIVDLPLTESLRKRFKTERSKDAYTRIFEQGQKYIDNVDNLATYSDVSKYRTFINNELSKSQRAGDRNAIEFFGNLYDNLTTLRTNAIKYNLKARPFVSKQTQITDLLDAQELADKMWRETHKKYEFLSDYLGIKTKNMTNLMDKLDEVNISDLADKVMRMKNLDHVQKFQLYFPEAADLARARMLWDIKSKASRTGVFSPKIFKNELNKLDESELRLLAPHLKNPKQLIADYSKVVDNLPKDANPSNTSVNMSFQSMFEIPYQGREAFRYAVYRSGPKSMLRQLVSRIPTAGSIEKAANQGKLAISDSVENFFKRTSEKTIKSINRIIVGRDLTDDEIEDTKKKIETYQQNPEAIIDMFVKNNKQLYETAPKTAEALQGKVFNAAQFISSKLPKKQPSLFDDSEVSRSEIMKFKNYMDAVENPYKVLSTIGSGYIAPEYMETFKIIYPKLAEELKKEFIERLPEFNKKLSEKQKASLSVILGTDNRKAYTSNGFNILQRNSAVQVNKDLNNNFSRKITSSGAKNLKNSQREQSGLDRVLYRS